MKDNKKEIDILTDTLIYMIFTLFQMNRGELTQMEVEEYLMSCMNTLAPLGNKRIKEISKVLN